MIDMTNPKADPIGRVVATELKPSTPHQFYFWTSREAPVGIGTIVRVEDEARVVYGVVTEAFAYSDLMTPLHDVIGADGDPVLAGQLPTERAEIRLFLASVLRQQPEEPLQAVPLSSVYQADDADVVAALRMDLYTSGERPTAIPVGVYSAGGLEAPVYLDADFLLGPEAAHLGITGVSGLATKTSAVEFMLTSIFQTFPAHKGSVAAVCFNVKGSDLCFLDQPGDLTDEDRALYQRLGLTAEPFANVRYYAPFKPDGVNLNTLRTHADLAHNTEPLVWGLREVLDYVNDRDRPLGLYLFTNDKQVEERVIYGTLSGGVTINNCMMHIAQHDMPFGGVGASGIGHYHGKEGFVEFSKMRPVHTNPRWSMQNQTYPPYTRSHTRMFDFLMKWMR